MAEAPTATSSVPSVGGGPDGFWQVNLPTKPIEARAI